MALTQQTSSAVVTSGEIKFSELRRQFKTISPRTTYGGSEDFSGDSDAISISASELLRSTDTSVTDPVVGDSTENASIATANDWKTSQLRNSVKYYFAQQTGTNTDVDGINQTFTSINFDIFEKTILILGSGGSAQTAKQILSNNNKILIASRNIQFGDISYPQVDSIAKNIDVVINTTPLGMPPHEKESLPINLQLFKNLQLFFNFGYKVSNTLIEGISPNVKIVDGMRMLIAQAISSFNIWTEQEIKFDDVYEDILERLENES